MSERIMYKGQRVELRQQRQRLVTECEALRDKIRAELSPVKDIENINTDTTVDAALALAHHVQSMTGLDQKLAILDRELDG